MKPVSASIFSFRMCVVLLVLSLPQNIRGQSPQEIDGLELWLNADSNIEFLNEKVFHWNNIIDSDVEFLFQGLDVDRPIVVVEEQLQGKKVVEFDGVGDFLASNNAIDIGTVFIVSNYLGQDSFPTYSGLLTSRNQITNGRVLIGQENSTHLYSEGIFGDQIYINSVLSLEMSTLSDYKIIRASPPEVISLPNFQLAKERVFTDRFWRGGIGHVLVYDRILNSEEITIVENYLHNYYTTAISIPTSIITENFCPVEVGPENWIGTVSWSDGDTISPKVFTKSGVYSVTFSDIFKRDFNFTIQVTFPGSYISDFSLCQGSDSLYTPNLESFDVVWQDGSTNPNYLITQAGQYSITVTDNLGCSYSDTVEVTTDFFPTDVALSAASPFCLGNTLSLASNAAETTSYSWSTGDTTAAITPQTDGTYCLEATNINGCIGRDTVSVTLAGTAPSVSFEMGVACAGNAVELTDTTFPEGSTITDWSWLIDTGADIDTLTGSSTEILFPETGAYPVALTVTLQTGCTGTGRDTISVNPLPLIDFNYDEVIPCAGNAVAFESQSGVPGNGTLATYAWEFDNGTTDTGFVGATVFENLGVHTVKHIVTTTAGCTDSLAAAIVVLGSPIADFAFDTVCVGMPTVFNQLVDTSISGSVFYNWQFGDGYFSNFPNTTHTYAAPGVYTVQLTATGNNFGNNGCVGTSIKEVRVYAAPQATIAAADGCLGAELYFTDFTTPAVVGGIPDPISTRLWTLPYGYGQGPVTVGSDSLQAWHPEEAGNFAVQLDLITAAGCTGTATDEVEVLAVPTAGFMLTIPEGEPPLMAIPTNTSTQAEGYSWSIDGQVVSTAFAPELSFADTGTFVVSLVATNSLGCNDTLTKSVTVIRPRYDLALLDIRYEVGHAQLALRLLLGNNGNTTLSNYSVLTSLGLSAEVATEAYFELAPGEVKEFLLPVAFEYLPSRDLPYVCMDIGILKNGVSVTETDTENNALCIGLEKEKAVFIHPYPNPTEGALNLGFVLPHEGSVALKVIDGMGKTVATYSWNMEEGYTLKKVDFSTYSEGMYLLRYLFDGEVTVKKVVVGG